MQAPNELLADVPRHAPRYPQACSATLRAAADELSQRLMGAADASALASAMLESELVSAPQAAASAEQIVGKSVEWKRSTHAGADARKPATNGAATRTR
jgi:hypothetical protein